MFLSPAVPIRPDTGLLARLVKSPRNLDAHLNSVLLVDRRDPARRRPAAAGQSPPPWVVGGSYSPRVSPRRSWRSSPCSRARVSPIDPGVWGMAVLLLPGLAAVVAGAATATAGSLARSGTLVALVGIAWIAAAWDAPGSPSPLVFTAGLVADSAALALAAHLLLGYPGGRLRGRARSVVVAAGYADLVGVVGIAPALFFAPASTGCPMPVEPPADDGQPRGGNGSRETGWRLGVAWITAVVLGVIIGRFTRRLPCRRQAMAPSVGVGGRVKCKCHPS